jgi:MFS family permease
MVQAGVSLHQVAHYINQGLPGTSAALTASTFAFSQIISVLIWAALARRVPVRFLLSMAAFVVAAAAIGTSASASVATSLIASASVGLGGLLRPESFREDTRLRDVGADRRTGRRTSVSWVHVRCHWLVSNAFTSVRWRSVVGWCASLVCYTAETSRIKARSDRSKLLKVFDEPVLRYPGKCPSISPLDMTL